MTNRHDGAERLFQAGRDELPGRELRERLLAIELPSERRSVWPVPRFAFASAAVALATTLLLFWPTRREPPRLAAEPTADRSAAAVTPSASEAEPAPEPPRRIAPVSSAEPPAPRVAPAKRPPATLPTELDSLRRVRTALAAGDTHAALDELDRYDRELRGTQLRAEASLLRIEALSRRGDPAAASRLAAAFVERHPHSPLVDRARTFLAAPAATGSNTAEAPIPSQ